jgi:hypothetical protein
VNGGEGGGAAAGPYFHVVFSLHVGDRRHRVSANDLLFVASAETMPAENLNGS